MFGSTTLDSCESHQEFLEEHFFRGERNSLGENKIKNNNNNNNNNETTIAAIIVTIYGVHNRIEQPSLKAPPPSNATTTTKLSWVLSLDMVPAPTTNATSSKGNDDTVLRCFDKFGASDDGLSSIQHFGRWI